MPTKPQVALEVDTPCSAAPLAIRGDRAETQATEQTATPKTGQIPDNAWLGPRDLANQAGVPQERIAAAAKRLERWRKDNPDAAGNGWMEAQDHGPNDPRHLYRYGSIKHILAEYLA